MIVSGIRNTQSELGQSLAQDMTGAGSFWYWIGAIVIIGAIGYIPALKTPSRLMLLLTAVAMVLANPGFFTEFLAAIQNPQPAAAPAAPVASTSSSSSGGSAGSIVGDVTGLLSGSGGTGNVLSSIGGSLGL